MSPRNSRLPTTNKHCLRRIFTPLHHTPPAMPHSVNKSISSVMSRPSTTSSNSATAFPRPAGVNLLAPEMVAEQRLSPSRSTFSFESSPKSHLDVDHKTSFDDRRPTSRGAQQAANGVTSNGSRRRAQYYEEQFAYKDDSVSSARDRVTRDAPVIAELRTNVIVRGIGYAYI